MHNQKISILHNNINMCIRWIYPYIAQGELYTDKNVRAFSKQLSMSTSVFPKAAGAMLYVAFYSAFKRASLRAANIQVWNVHHQGGNLIKRLDSSPDLE